MFSEFSSLSVCLSAFELSKSLLLSMKNVGEKKKNKITAIRKLYSSSTLDELKPPELKQIHKYKNEESKKNALNVPVGVNLILTFK